MAVVAASDMDMNRAVGGGGSGGSGGDGGGDDPRRDRDVDTVDVVEEGGEEEEEDAEDDGVNALAILSGIGNAYQGELGRRQEREKEILAERARVRKDIKNKRARDKRLLNKACKNLTPEQLVHAAGLLAAKGSSKGKGGRGKGKGTGKGKDK